MQSKGAIKLVAILLALACFWQLSFTAVTALQEKKAANYAEKAALAAQSSAAFSKVPEAEQAYYLDSIRKEQNRVNPLAKTRNIVLKNDTSVIIITKRNNGLHYLDLGLPGFSCRSKRSSMVAFTKHAQY